MSELVNLFREYLRDQSADYALMISGPWGSGKSYFWRHTLEAIAKQPPVASSAKEPSVAYVSMYGLTNTDEIHRELLFALHPRFGGKTAKVLRVLASMGADRLGIDLTKASIDMSEWMRLEDAVICFDDLERCSIPIGDVLGCINYYVEHKRAKAILLCNEDAIRENEQREYRRIKEKVVGFTASFALNYADLLESMLGSLSAEDAGTKCLKEQENLILSLFQKSELRNIRILRRALSTLSRVYASLDANAASDEAVKKQLVFSVIPLVFEHLSGRATPDELQEVASGGQVLLFASTIRGDGEPSVASRYAARYFIDDAVAPLVSRALFDYVTRGSLDVELLKRELTEHTVLRTKGERAFNALAGNYYRLSDEEFQTHWISVYNEFKQNAISTLDDLFSLYCYALRFADRGLIDRTRNEIKAEFESYLNNGISAARFNHNPNLPDELPRFAAEGDCDAMAFREQVLHINLQLKVASDRETADEFLRLLRNGDKSGLIRFVHDWSEVPLLDVVSADALAGALAEIPNALKVSFRSALRKRYMRQQISSVQQLERDGVLRLKSCLERLVHGRDARPRPLSVDLLEQIVLDLQEVAHALAPRVVDVGSTSAESKH